MLEKIAKQSLKVLNRLKKFKQMQIPSSKVHMVLNK